MRDNWLEWWMSGTVSYGVDAEKNTSLKWRLERMKKGKDR